VQLVREPKSAATLVDAVCELCEKEKLLLHDVEFATMFQAAVMAPLCREAREMLLSGALSETSVLKSVESCPPSLRPSLDRLHKVARSVRLLERMGLRPNVTIPENDWSWASVLGLCDRLYRSECTRLVSLILNERGGLLVVQEMRESFGNAPASADWPVSELLWTDANKAGYQAVGRFVERLERAKRGEFLSFFFFFLPVTCFERYFSSLECESC
jgi:hypothetical protein